MIYEGNFDLDNLDQDFVKALVDSGIDESTIEYIFKMKQQEYQLLIDEINEKYPVSEVPSQIRKDYIGTDENGETIAWSEYVDVDEETKSGIEKINTINQTLSDYAKENSSDFELLISYDGNFEVLDKYIFEEEEKLSQGMSDADKEIYENYQDIIQEVKDRLRGIRV